MAAKISEALKYQIRKSGLNVKTAAERFRISTRAASRILYGEEPDPRPRLRIMSEDFIRAVGQAQGGTEMLAERFGVSVQTIRRAKEKWAGPERVTINIDRRIKPNLYQPFRDGTYPR